MKKIALVFSATFLLSISYSLAQTTAAQLKNTLNDIISTERARYEMLHNFELSGAGQNVDIKYHRFNWRIDPSVRRIAGSVTTYFQTLQNVTDLSFDLDNRLRVDSVWHRGGKINFTQQSDKTLHSVVDIAANRLDSVTVFYQGTPPTTGFGSYVQRSRGGSFETWTLSAPYGSRDWWPSKMDLADKIDSIDIIVTTPPQYRVASNGILVSETQVDAQNKTFHWKHRYPITQYLVAIAITNFVQYTDPIRLSRGDSMHILNYVYPENLTASQRGSKQVAGSMRLFDSLFTEYPFKREKYGHAQFGWGGGMEHQTMSFMVSLENSGLIAHELAHQWFGDMITCGSWQDIWLNEGFATYLTGLHFQYVEPLWWRNWRVQTLRDATAPASGSIVVPAADTLNVNRVFDGALTYNKGAYALHTLRYKIGDSAFFAGIRNYLKDPNLAYSFAKTADLKRHLETASRQDLTEFFNDYLYGQGYPSYQVEVRRTGSLPTPQIPISINQTQSNSSVRFFEMPVPIKLISKSTGRDSTYRIDVSAATNTVVEFPLSYGRVDSVVFDPELQILSKNNTVRLTTVSVQDIDSQWLTSLSPNPVQDILTFSFSHDRIENAHFEVINPLGQTIFSTKRQTEIGQNSPQISIGHLPSGFYFLKIATAEKLASRRFFKN
jgi:aminopeptidase N